MEKWSAKIVLGCLNPNAGPGFNSEEVFSGNKTFDQHSGVNPKNTFLGVQSYHLKSKNPISTNPYINYSLQLTLTSSYPLFGKLDDKCCRWYHAKPN